MKVSQTVVNSDKLVIFKMTGVEIEIWTWVIYFLPPDHVDFKIWNTSWNDILEALSLLSIHFTSESVNQSFFMQWRISAKVVRAHPLCFE